MEYYSVIKKEWKLATCSEVNGLGSFQSEISQTEKDKYCMILVKCGIKKIQQTSEYNKKEADSQL